MESLENTEKVSDKCAIEQQWSRSNVFVLCALWRYAREGYGRKSTLLKYWERLEYMIHGITMLYPNELPADLLEELGLLEAIARTLGEGEETK